MRELIARPGRIWIALSWLWAMFVCFMMAGKGSVFQPRATDYLDAFVGIALPPMAALWLKTVYLYLRKKL
jgi:hypothetical protein